MGNAQMTIREEDGRLYGSFIADKDFSFSASSLAHVLKSITCIKGSLSITINGVESTIRGGDPEVLFADGENPTITALEDGTEFNVVKEIFYPPAPVEEPAPVVPE